MISKSHLDHSTSPNGSGGIGDRCTTLGSIDATHPPTPASQRRPPTAATATAGPTAASAPVTNSAPPKVPSWAAVRLCRRRVAACAVADGGAAWVFGGADDGASVETVAPHPPRVLPGRLVTPRMGAVAAMIREGVAVVMGGCDGEGDLDTVEAVDLRTGKSTLRKARLITPRTYAAGAVVNGRPYIFGGWCARNAMRRPQVPVVLNSAEYYDPDGDAMVHVWGVMVERRQQATAAGVRSLAFIAGGSHNGVDLASIEMFDSTTGKFELLDSTLSVGRSGACAVCMNESVFVVGGKKAGEILCVIDVILTDVQRVVNVGLTRIPRYLACAVLVQKSFFLVGGDEAGDTLEKWRPTKTELVVDDDWPAHIE